MMFRLRLLFLDRRDYISMKLRTLLANYGYKIRTGRLNAFLKGCMCFYHIESYVKGGEPCDIANVKLDETIIFRVIKNNHGGILPAANDLETQNINIEMPVVNLGNKVITITLGGVEKHLALTQGRIESGYVSIDFGRRRFNISLKDGDISEVFKE